MRYRKKRLMLLKQKHIKIIIIALGAALVLWAVLAIISATTHESKKHKAVDAVISKGMINIGLRGDLGALSTYNEQTLTFEGFEKDLTDALVEHLFDEDIIVNYVLVNSRTKDAMLKQSEIDIALAASIEQSVSGITFSSPYYADASAFLVSEGRMDTMQGLNGGIIGVVQGTLQAQASETTKDATKMADYLALLQINAQVKVYASYPEAVAALRAGFVDGICASELMLKLFGTKNMVILSERFMPNNYCVGIRDTLGFFSEAVDDAISAMRLDGTLDALTEKWKLTNYAELDQ